MLTRFIALEINALQKENKQNHQMFAFFRFTMGTFFGIESATGSYILRMDQATR